MLNEFQIVHNQYFSCLFSVSLISFYFAGFDALAYQEHLDYSLVQSTNPEYNKALVRVNIFRDHRQTIQVDDFEILTTVFSKLYLQQSTIFLVAITRVK